MLFHKIVLLEFTPRQISRIALAICYVAVITSCQSMETRYNYIKQYDTVKYYDQFLKDHPESIYVEDAKKRRKQVILRNKQRHAKWKEKEKKREIWRKKRKKQINETKIKLAESAKKRINSSKSVPKKPNDPGYPIVFCEITNLSDKVLYIRFPYTRGSFFDIGYKPYICGNTGAGKQVLRWRQWYCNDVTDVYDCVAGRWKNDEPTFLGVAGEQKEIIKMRRGEPELIYRRIQF